MCYFKRILENQRLETGFWQVTRHSGNLSKIAIAKSGGNLCKNQALYPYVIVFRTQNFSYFHIKEET